MKGGCKLINLKSVNQNYNKHIITRFSFIKVCVRSSLESVSFLKTFVRQPAISSSSLVVKPSAVERHFLKTSARALFNRQPRDVTLVLNSYDMVWNSVKQSLVSSCKI